MCGVRGGEGGKRGQCRSVRSMEGEEMWDNLDDCQG